MPVLTEMSDSEKTIKTLCQKARFEFPIIGPKHAINVQCERDKWSVFEVYFAKPASFHPSAHRDHALVHESYSSQKGVETLQQFVFIQLRQSGDSLLVLKKLHDYESR